MPEHDGLLAVRTRRDNVDGHTGKRLQTLAGVPIDIISTGPDREQTIVLRHPFD